MESRPTANVIVQCLHYLAMQEELLPLHTDTGEKTTARKPPVAPGLPLVEHRGSNFS